MQASSAIRSARQQAGLTQAQLASRAGTSQATLSAYERGRKVPSLATLDRILQAAGQRLTVVRAPRSPTPDELARVERQLADVLALAAELPTRHSRDLRYPPLHRRAA